nr:hypothetical protein [Tanacetum cinerariifolium]
MASVETLPETVVTKEVEEINTTPAAEAPKEAEPIVGTLKPVAEEPKEETAIVEEPKEEMPVKEEAETTETVVEESKEETVDVVPQETPEPLKEEENTVEVAGTTETDEVAVEKAE